MSDLTVRPRWYSGPNLLVLCAFAVCVVSGFFSRGAFGVALIMAVIWFLGKFGTKIEVTPAEVGFKTWLVRRRSAPRDAVQSMHWYERQFTFAAADQVLLGIPSFGWTRGQLLDLSEALGVPLYNHRTKRGFGRDAGVGQVMRRPARAK